MSGASVLSLVIGLLQLVLVLALSRELGRYGRTFPWLAALAAFFALRGVTRIYAALAGEAPEALTVPADLLLIAALLLLIVGIDRTARGLKLAKDDARYREEEYNRALDDYRRLARHRLANPLTVIRGGVATLKELPNLSSQQRDQLLDAIERETHRLEKIALEPDPTGREERKLRPRPKLP